MFSPELRTCYMKTGDFSRGGESIALAESTVVRNDMTNDRDSYDEQLTLKELSEEEILLLRETRMERDFPPEELKKPQMLSELFQKGVYLAYSAFCGETEIGYSFFSIDSAGKGLCLLDYFAVDEAYRDRGLGSRLVSLFAQRFSQKSVLLCEVEDPFREKDPQKQSETKRRMNFYLNDVDYRILAAPVGHGASREEIIEDYRRIYLDVVGEENLKKKLKVYC